MNIRVNGRHITVNDRIRSHLEEQTAKLERYLPNLDEVHVELSKNQSRASEDRFTCQVTVWDHRNILRAEETDGSVYHAIDAAVKKLSHRIEKVRGRQKKHQHVSLAESSAAALAEVQEAAEPEGRLVRRKSFTLPPMDEDEAIEQMELLGHSFFLFRRHSSKAVNLVYRRADGNYGLLQPTLD